MSARFWVVVSSIFFAMIPLALSHSSPQALFFLFFLMPLFRGVFSFLVAGLSRKRLWDLCVFFKDPDLKLLSFPVLSVFAGMGAFVCLGYAMTMGHSPLMVVLGEIWPLFAALAIGFFMKDDVQKMGFMAYVQMGIVFLGLFFVFRLWEDSFLDVSFLGVGLAVFSSVLMGLSTTGYY